MLVFCLSDCPFRKMTLMKRYQHSTVLRVSFLLLCKHFRIHILKARNTISLILSPSPKIEADRIGSAFTAPMSPQQSLILPLQLSERYL